MTAAADASGLLITTLQLGQVTGVATFGSLLLTLAGPGRFSLPASPHAIALTSGLLALLFAIAAAAALPLSRVVRSRRAAGPGPERVTGSG